MAGHGHRPGRRRALRRGGPRHTLNRARAVAAHILTPQRRNPMTRRRIHGVRPVRVARGRVCRRIARRCPCTCRPRAPIWTPPPNRPLGAAGDAAGRIRLADGGSGPSPRAGGRRPLERRLGPRPANPPPPRLLRRVLKALPCLGSRAAQGPRLGRRGVCAGGARARSLTLTRAGGRGRAVTMSDFEEAIGKISRSVGQARPPPPFPFGCATIT